MAFFIRESFSFNKNRSVFYAKYTPIQIIFDTSIQLHSKNSWDLKPVVFFLKGKVIIKILKNKNILAMEGNKIAKKIKGKVTF